MDHDYKAAIQKLDEYGSAGCVFEIGEGAIRSSLEIARKLQEGYTLVPNEPTEEMIKRGCDKFLSFGRGSNGICNAYRTMIEAAQEIRKG